MAASILVDQRVAGGRKLIGRLVAEGFPLTLAFWAKAAESGLWSLYLATEAVGGFGSLAAYRRVQETLGRGGPTGLGLSEITLLNPSDPTARAALEVRRLDPMSAPTHIGAATLGPLEVEEVYLYPPHLFERTVGVRMTADDVVHDLIESMKRQPDSQRPIRVTALDGASFRGLPIGLQLGEQQAMVAQFLAEGESTPRVLRIDQIASVD